MSNEYFDDEDMVDDMGDWPELGAGEGGVCRVCGCTEDDPCPGGCIWATPDCDLCSQCARNL
jgi:hypothetical protein